MKKRFSWTNRVRLPLEALRVGAKLGTTKVQLGADGTEGADSAEDKTCIFPKKIKNSQ